MKRLDKNAALKASPVKIVLTILDALIDASKSQEAQITITLKKDLERKGVFWPGTGVRIEYGGCNTFVEEPDRRISDDTYNLQNVFRFLSKALAQRNEEEENEIRAAQRRESIAAAKRAQDSMDSATEAAIKYLPDAMDLKDSADAE